MKLKLFLFAFVFLIGSAEQISAQKFLDKVLKGLEKTNQVLDEADKVLGTDESGSSSSQRSSRGKRVAGFKIVSPHPDLDIQFKRCAASASTVVIDLVMTWYGDDRKLTIGRNGVYSESTAFDDQGNQYDNGKNQNITANIANGEFSSEPRALFPSDVPLKVRIQITDVKRDANTFKRFILLVGGMNDPITFYNIPIERADEVTSVNSNQATPNKVLSDNSPLIAEQENTQELQTGSEKKLITRHPLTDPLMNVMGGHSAVYPSFLYYTQHEKNDWCVYGLRGKVKTLTEKYTDHNNRTTSYIYHFSENGFLENIDFEGKNFLFVTRNNAPMNKKIYADNEELKATNQDTYKYNDKGQLVASETFIAEIQYDYNEQGLCNQIQYQEEYPDNMAKVKLNFTRNEQGDITRLDQNLVFYTQVYDSKTQTLSIGKQDGDPQKTSHTIRYTYDEQNNWTSCASDICNIKRTIVYY